MTPPPQNLRAQADLHIHTYYSDGTFSPKEVVRRAKELGLAAISLTDHDTIAGIQEALEAAGNSLEVIPGVELTAAFKDRELHILGFFVDSKDAAFLAFLQRMAVYRRERIQAMIERLRAHGVTVTFEEVEALQGKGTLGRPHLAEALVKREVVRSMDEAFRAFIGDHAPCFVKGATLTPVTAVELIQKAHGVAVLAHPYRIVEDAWIPELVGAGIQGIEVYHSDHSSSVAKAYRQMAERFNLLVTGGSDCHGMRRSKGPLLGSVTVPYSDVERLKAAARGL